MKEGPSCRFPFFTIITASYNCKRHIISTINSIRDQRYNFIEWIIVDGGSTDGTVEVIKESANLVSHFISEKDSGIYDAWNKACKLISGNWVLFLGAGDEFCDENVLYNLSNYVREAPDFLIFYGRVRVQRGRHIIEVTGEVDTVKWQKGVVSIPCHQGVVHPAVLFEGSNSFDETYKVLGDAKFLIKKQIEGYRFKYINLDISVMDADGISSKPELSAVIYNEQDRIRNELKLARTFVSEFYRKRLLLKSFGYLYFGKRFSFIVNIWRLLSGKKRYD